MSIKAIARLKETAACAIYTFDGSQKSRQNILRATSLDTDSREEFDDKAWDWIQEYAR